MNEELKFETILKTLQRSINCLADQDRNIRKSGLDTIKTQLMKMSKQNTLKLFTQTKLTSLLTKIVGDQIQNIRQVGMDVIQIFIKTAGSDGKIVYEQLMPSMISRINETPFPEKSEQLRLKILNILITLVQYKECFNKYLPELGSCLGKCLADAYDKIKQSSCNLTNKICLALSHDIGKYSSQICLSLRDNLKNQKFKVRKTSLQTIGYILVTDGAGGNYQQLKVAIKAILSDKKQQVRLAAFHCVSHLLRFLAPKYMRQYEAHLIGLLLAGLDDQSANIVKEVVQQLQKCGKKLKQQAQEHEHAMTNQNSSSQQN